MSKQSDAYAAFFLKNEEGQKLLTAIEGIISSQHELAEKSPELARDHTQRAKGARLVQEHIQSVLGGVKRP
jgi:hypothetical protein